MVAFVRDNNLFVVDLASQREQAITTDGNPERLNGKLDWLYQEEIYGRGQFKGYWWSPDSTRLAFLQLDERPVPEYTVVDHIPYRPALEVTDYPKAGDPNPTVKLGLARVAGGGPSWVDLSEYSALEFLIVNVGWTPDSLAGRSPGAGPRADLAGPEAGRRVDRTRASSASRDDVRVGQRERQPGVAEGRIVPLVQRAQRLQASLSLQRRRGDGQTGHNRPLGSPDSCSVWTRPTAWRTSRQPSGIRLRPTSIGFDSTATG